MTIKYDATCVAFVAQYSSILFSSLTDFNYKLVLYNVSGSKFQNWCFVCNFNGCILVWVCELLSCSLKTFFFTIILLLNKMYCKELLFFMASYFTANNWFGVVVFHAVMHNSLRLHPPPTLKSRLLML